MAEVKLCSKCGDTKPVAEFYRDKNRKDGRGPHCKVCCRQWRRDNPEKVKRYRKKDYEQNAETYKRRAKEWARENLEQKKRVDKAWRERNRERKAALDRGWYEANKDRKRAYDQEYRPQYYRDNKHMFAAQAAKRRARIANATPAWSDISDDNSSHWRVARLLTRLTGEEFEVDHIVPLCGKTVCGLHVSWNLRVVRKSINRSKGNKLIESLCSL